MLPKSNNNDPTFNLFCLIFLLSHAVLFSHPLALGKVDISLQWGASWCANSDLITWYMSEQVVTWAQNLLHHLYTTFNVYGKLSSHNVILPFISDLSLVWMKTHSTGILANLLSCHLAFLIVQVILSGFYYL